jgi:threonyl-tRNA synthetase
MTPYDFFIDVQTSDAQLAKKIREAQNMQYNFILVVGEEEERNGTVNVRARDKQEERNVVTLSEARALFMQLVEEKK